MKRKAVAGASFPELSRTGIPTIKLIIQYFVLHSNTNAGQMTFQSNLCDMTAVALRAEIAAGHLSAREIVVMARPVISAIVRSVGLPPGLPAPSVRRG